MAGGVNLAALSLVAAGGVLMYAAVNDPVGGPVGVVRDLMSGRTPTPGAQTVTQPLAPGVARLDPRFQTVEQPGDNGDRSGLEPRGSGSRSAVVAAARRFLGVPYVWGGASLSGVDCSGLVLVAYRDGAGITLPHRATAQAARGRRVPRAQCQPGDLVAWGVPGNYPHIALAVDGQNAIVASTYGTVVSVKPIDRKAVPGYGYPDIISLLD